MKERLPSTLKAASRLRIGSFLKYGVVKSFQKYGFVSSTYSSSTTASNFDDITHVPSDLFSGERKERFIKQIEELSKLYKHPVTRKASFAGILIPFCISEGKLSVLLTKRSHKLVRNKGDVSFPGGKMDDGDKYVIETVLRETNEEIGLSRSNIEIWTTLKPILTTDRVLKVIPVIGFVKNLEMSSLIIDQNEVSSVFTASLEDLCNPGNQAYTKLRSGLIMPLFFVEPYTIWGFTAIILDFLLANLLPNMYSQKCTGTQNYF